MDLEKMRFLLDENVPIKLVKIFSDRGIYCTTIRKEKLSGIKNGELSKKVKELKLILITRDKDFTYLWNKYKINVIYIAIEPAILDFIQPRMVELLDDWKYDIKKPFLLILQKDIIRFWQ